jgi:hypothetical protein
VTDEPDDLNRDALERLWPPDQWLSRIGTLRERNGYGERPREIGPRGELRCAEGRIPINEIHGEIPCL